MNTSTPEQIAAAQDLLRALVRIKETGDALVESYRQLNLTKVAHLLEDLAPCPRPGLIGWLDARIDELKESGIPEGETPRSMIESGYLEWIAKAA
jgi:hypothetical protein